MKELFMCICICKFAEAEMIPQGMKIRSQSEWILSENCHLSHSAPTTKAAVC